MNSHKMQVSKSNEGLRTQMSKSKERSRHSLAEDRSGTRHGSKGQQSFKLARAQIHVLCGENKCFMGLFFRTLLLMSLFQGTLGLTVLPSEREITLYRKDPSTSSYLCQAIFGEGSNKILCEEAVYSITESYLQFRWQGRTQNDNPHLKIPIRKSEHNYLNNKVILDDEGEYWRFQLMCTKSGKTTRHILYLAADQLKPNGAEDDHHDLRVLLESSRTRCTINGDNKAYFTQDSDGVPTVHWRTKPELKTPDSTVCCDKLEMGKQTCHDSGDSEFPAQEISMTMFTLFKHEDGDILVSRNSNIEEILERRVRYGKRVTSNDNVIPPMARD